MRECIGAPPHVQRYLSKISGPLLDRIDLHVEVIPVSFDKLNKRGEKLISPVLRGEEPGLFKGRREGEQGYLRRLDRERLPRGREWWRLPPGRERWPLPCRFASVWPLWARGTSTFGVRPSNPS